MRTTRIIPTLVVATVLVGAACSAGSDSDASSTASDAGSSPSTTIATGAPADDSDGSGGGDGDAITAVPRVDLIAAQVDRKIVYTGEIRSEVDDASMAARSARDAVAAEGGFLFGQQISEDSARVVLKVPAVRFDAAFDAVVGIGEVLSQEVAADDVSEQFTDLASRQATLETSIDRLRGFLAAAGNVDEISRLESELTRREAEHDVVAGQLRVLQDRTALGTITVTFTEPAKEKAVAATEDGGGPPGFSRGLEVGWVGVVVAAGAAATAAGFLLPFVPLLLLAAALAWWQRRRTARAFAVPTDA